MGYFIVEKINQIIRAAAKAWFLSQWSSGDFQYKAKLLGKEAFQFAKISVVGCFLYSAVFSTVRLCGYLGVDRFLSVVDSTIGLREQVAESVAQIKATISALKVADPLSDVNNVAEFAPGFLAFSLLGYLVYVNFKILRNLLFRLLGKADELDKSDLKCVRKEPNPETWQKAM